MQEVGKQLMANALVWGGEGGIGSALIRVLAADEWLVASIARKTGSSEATIALEADVTSTLQISQALEEVSQTLGEIDLWVYAIGDIAVAHVGDQSPEDWWRILDANLTGAFLATRASLPLLTAGAHLIFLGAQPVHAQRPGLAAYAAAKSGLEAFAAVLAKEEPGRRVSLVRPGPVATPLWDKVGAKAPRGAAQPDALAAQILNAYRSGHQGLLDL